MLAEGTEARLRRMAVRAEGTSGLLGGKGWVELQAAECIEAMLVGMVRARMRAWETGTAEASAGEGWLQAARARHGSHHWWTGQM